MYKYLFKNNNLITIYLTSNLILLKKIENNKYKNKNKHKKRFLFIR